MNRCWKYAILQFLLITSAGFVAKLLLRVVVTLLSTDYKCRVLAKVGNPYTLETPQSSYLGVMMRPRHS
jgi:hypothetical protein